MATTTVLITHSYSKALLVFSIVVSIPALFLFSIGLMKMSYMHLIVWGGVLITVWGAFAGIRKKNIIIFWLSLTMISAMWLVLLLQTMKRIMFVIENGGMERADGFGSPLAFLIGVIGEQLFFLPACAVIVIGWLSVFNYFKRNNENAP